MTSMDRTYRDLPDVPETHGPCFTCGTDTIRILRCTRCQAVLYECPGCAAVNDTPPLCDACEDATE